MTPRPARLAASAMGLRAAIASCLLASAGFASAATDINAAIELRIRGADSARVVRIREPLSGEQIAGEDRLDDWIVVREGRADSAWKSAMAGALAGAIKHAPEPEICPRDGGPRHIRFGVQFTKGTDRTTLVVYLAEQCVEFWTGRTFRGSASIRSHTAEILALLKRAFPTDTTVRHLGPKGVISCEDYMREHGGAALVEQQPEATRRVPAKYPAEARKAMIEGVVMLEANIGVDGAVGEVKITKSIPELDAAAVAAVREWRFEPALDCWGQPVSAWVPIPVRFSLN